MKRYRWLAFTLVFIFFACQPPPLPIVTIIDSLSGQIITLETDERVPSAVLNQAGLALNSNDRFLFNALAVALDQPITGTPITLQIRRAVTLTLNAPDGQQ